MCNSHPQLATILRWPGYTVKPVYKVTLGTDKLAAILRWPVKTVYKVTLRTNTLPAILRWPGYTVKPVYKVIPRDQHSACYTEVAWLYSEACV